MFNKHDIFFILINNILQTYILKIKRLKLDIFKNFKSV